VEMMKDMSQDKYGITFGELNATDISGVKTVALAGEAGGKYADLTPDNVRDRSYPLYLEIYGYVARDPSQPLDPKLKEFLRYILSREGQEAVQQDGQWLPLTAAAAQKQLAKLE
jgi:phosphate transport system substrate-binding protein